MKGLCELTSMKSITIRNNEILDLTIENLVTILKRPFPQNLEELRLIKVKTSPYMITDLMDELSETCLLKKINLIKC